MASEAAPPDTAFDPIASDSAPAAFERQPTAAELTPPATVSEPSAVPLLAAARTFAFLPTAVAFVESAEATSPTAVD